LLSIVHGPIASNAAAWSNTRWLCHPYTKYLLWGTTPNLIIYITFSFQMEHIRCVTAQFAISVFRYYAHSISGAVHKVYIADVRYKKQDIVAAFCYCVHHHPYILFYGGFPVYGYDCSYY